MKNVVTEKEEADKKELVVVTAELLRKLRLQGNKWEANVLYRAWLKNCKAQRKQDRKMRRRDDAKREHFILKVSGVCVSCRENPSEEGHVRCVECAEKFRKWRMASKRRQKAKKYCRYGSSKCEVRRGVKYPLVLCTNHLKLRLAKRRKEGGKL